MGHLDSQRSLTAIGPNKIGFSAFAKKLRLAPGHSVVVLKRAGGLPQVAAARPRKHDNRAAVGPVLFVKDADKLRRLGSAAVHAATPNGLLWITYPKGGKTEGMTDLPATPLWVRRDVLGEMTGETGYKAVAFVAVDDTWTALRFKRL